MRNQIDFQVPGRQLLFPIGKRAHRNQLSHTVRCRRSLLTPPTGMFSHQVKLTIYSRSAHRQKSGPHVLIQLQMPVPFHGSQQQRQQRFQPLATNPVRCLPEHDQRFLYRLVINPPHHPSLRLACGLRGENPYRMLTMVPSHLGELIQDHLLAYPVCRSITLSDGCCQFPSCAQLDSSPHFPPSGVVHAGSIFHEATTHLSVANLVSQCARPLHTARARLLTKSHTMSAERHLLFNCRMDDWQSSTVKVSLRSALRARQETTAVVASRL